MSTQFVLEVFQFVIEECNLYIPRLVQTKLQPCIFDGAYSPELCYNTGLVDTSYAKSLYSFVGIGRTPENLSPVDIREIIGVNFYGVTPPCGFSSSEVKDHGVELGICLSGAFCLSGLWEGTKFEVGAGMGQIRRDCRGFGDMNAAVFAWGGVGNAEFALFFEEDKANTEEAEELICFTFKDEDRGEVLIGVTDLAEGEISLIGPLTRFVFDLYLKPLLQNFVEISL